MDASGLPPEFVGRLLATRKRVMPFVGAGLAIAAGVRDFAGSLRAAAVEAGVEMPPVSEETTLLRTAQAIARELGEARAKEIAAAVIGGVPVRSTPTLRALVQVPSRMLATFNYALALEQS